MGEVIVPKIGVERIDRKTKNLFVRWKLASGEGQEDFKLGITSEFLYKNTGAYYKDLRVMFIGPAKEFPKGSPFAGMINDRFKDYIYLVMMVAPVGMKNFKTTPVNFFLKIELVNGTVPKTFINMGEWDVAEKKLRLDILKKRKKKVKKNLVEAERSEVAPASELQTKGFPKKQMTEGKMTVAWQGRYKIKFRWYGGWFSPTKKQEEEIRRSLHDDASGEILNLLEEGKPIALLRVLPFECWLKMSK